MKWATLNELILSYNCTKWLFVLICKHLCPSLPVSNCSVMQWFHPQHRCGMSRCCSNSVTSTQTLLILGTIKGHLKMSNFIRSRHATDVANHAGTCHWHAGCRDVHQSGCCTAECSLSDDRSFESLLQTDWQYSKSTSPPSSTCDHPSTRSSNPAPPPAWSSQTSNTHSRWNNWPAQQTHHTTNCPEPSERSKPTRSSS